jgi:uncharacterized membrane protein YjjP (DUF1212 family)
VKTLPKRLHTVKTCPCLPCAKRREHAQRIHKALHSPWMHLTVFAVVAVALAALAEHKWITGLSGGVVASKAVELLGEIVAERMLPDQLLRG